MLPQLAHPSSLPGLLVLVIEESAEVQKAATKALRFGWDHDEPGYGRNDVEFFREVGDLYAVIGELESHWMTIIAEDAMRAADATKMARALAAYQRVMGDPA